MKHTEGHEWMGSVLYDVACFGLAISTGFLVQNIVILVTVPKVKDGDDVISNLWRYLCFSLHIC